MEKPKVLVVEDDPIVAADLKHKLRDFGYEVCAKAVTGEEAIEAAKEHRPAVVLMDITLEGKMDGVDAAEEIRKTLALPVVYLTAHSDQTTVERAKLTLPYGYVLKPIREIELKIALEMAIYNGLRQREERSHPIQLPHSSRVKPLSDGERRSAKAILSKIDPFTRISDELLNSIAAECSFQDYRALEVISMEGERADVDGFIVVSGRVAMLKTSPNGRELVVQLIGPRSTFGLLASLDTSTQELTARAQIETRLLHLPKKSLLYLLTEMPDLYPDFLAELSKRMSALHNMARSLAHDKVDVRVAATLATLLDSEDSGVSPGEAAEIKMSRQELANLAGTTVETAIRITRGLEESGILELTDHRKIRVLNPEKLRVAAQGMDY